MEIKFYLKTISAIILVVAGLSSCQKDDNSQSQLNLSVSADSSSFIMTNALGNSSGSLLFNTGSLTVNSFKFDAVVEKVPTETITKGPYMLDLFTPNPNVYVLPLQRGFYDNVQIKVSIIKSSVKAPLIISGQYINPMGVGAPIEIDINENTDFILKIKDQLVTDQFTGYTAYMKLFLTRLLKGINSSDLDRAIKTNNNLLITSAINKPIYSKIKTNLVTSLGGDVSEVDVNDN